MTNNKIKNSGYVALISMLVIGAIGLSVTISLILLGLSSSRSSFTLEQSNQAKSLANACMEEALQQIWKNDSYVGMGNMTFAEGSCTYSISGSTSPKAIISSGLVGTVVRKVSVSIDQFRPYLHLSSWQEIP